MFIPRVIEKQFNIALNNFPAVLVTGPRQSGKTTFVREIAGENRKYVTFDDPLTREYAQSDPKGFLSQFNDQPVILDEIQYVPGLFSYIKIAIDTNRNLYGKWIMTGSQQFNIMKNIADSLAGRVGILHLLPFFEMEHDNSLTRTLEDTLWYGGYPENILRSGGRDLWLSSYIGTYIERDIRQIHNVHNLGLFQSFISLCASNHSRELSYASLSRQIGISQPAARSWISIMEASFIIVLLMPFYENFGKRLIKSPKLYFLDSALAAYLTRQANSETLLSGSMGGSFFEGFIITEVYKMLIARENRAEVFFWRSNDQIEVDLIIEKNGTLFPVEIKKTATPTLKHAQPLQRFKAFAGKRKIGVCQIVCLTDQDIQIGENIMAVSWKSFLKWLGSGLT